MTEAQEGARDRIAVLAGGETTASAGAAAGTWRGSMSAIDTGLCPDCGQPLAAHPPPLHVTPGPSVVIRSEDAGEHWCFRCRKRLPHTWVLLDDPPERQPSYYDPVWSCRCSGCGEGRTQFPGTGFA